MRLQLMATYLGVPYQAGLGPDGTEVTLFSPAPPPEELGFTAAAGHWRKQVDVADLGALWQSRPVGDYRGEPWLGLDDLGDRLHIAYLGRDPARAAQLGYWEIDREVFEVVVARHDVTGLTEERVEYPLAAALFPPSDGGPQAPDGTLATAPAAEARATGPQPVAGAGAGVGESVPGSRSPASYSPPARSAPPASSGPPGPYGSRMPDRAAAWHGSPAAEPWPGPEPAPWAQGAQGVGSDQGAGSDQGVGSDQGAQGVGSDLDEPDPRAGPQAARERRRPGPWTEPWPERETGPEPWTEDEPWSDPWTEEPGSEPDTASPPARRTGRKGRISPESVFAELLALADIPRAAYAVDKEVPGAMCLVQADGGFEVFSRTEDARLEVRFFEDEEAAYFYLFGMLAAEAIRSGRLGPTASTGPTGSGRINGHSNGSGPVRASSTSQGNVSNYLRG
ncbi:MAG: hypothetical protein ACRDOB_22700 [Streptosporangiaceae bacterium]